jgi:AcrR family transcriptional regulator
MGGSSTPLRAAAEETQRAPIPRGARARERVLRAALEVLADHGMPGFTMEAIAHRAGASNTVYRHWASPAALLVDAMDMSFQPLPLPAAGQLRTDLIELLSGFEARLGDQPFPRLMAAVVDAAERHQSLSKLHVQLTERRREPVRYVLAKAQERGELPASADLELGVDLLTGPFFYRRFIAHRAFPDGYAIAVVDHVLAALSSSCRPSIFGRDVEKASVAPTP